MELKVICKRLITQNIDGNITEGEYGADIIGISVPRLYGKNDLSTFSFRLTAISKLNKSIAEQVLTMDAVDEENIHLLWEVTPDFTAASGKVTLILAGVNSDNTVQIKFISQPVIINDDYRLEFIESATVLEQAYNQVQLEVQKAVDAAERAEEASLKPILVPVATETRTGGFLSGGDISVNENGIVTVNSVSGKTIGTSVPENAVFTDTVYTLPTASAKKLGGVKIDDNTIKINADGIISATGGTCIEGVKILNENTSYEKIKTSNYPLLALSLYGKSTQDGTPTPETPIDIVSVGDDGDVEITVDNDNGIALSAIVTSGLPLCSVGDYRDELIYNADGTGKIIKRIRKVVFDGSEKWNQTSTTNEKYRMTMNIGGYESLYGDNYTNTTISLVVSDQYNAISYKQADEEINGIALLHTTGKHLSIYDENYATATVDEWKAHLAQNPLTVIYVLNTPQEIELSAAEMAALRHLHTFNDVTNIYNDEETEMMVEICVNKEIAEIIKPIMDGFEKRIEDLEAAVLSLGSNV